jgi:hypothetical protein
MPTDGRAALGKSPERLRDDPSPGEVEHEIPELVRELLEPPGS